MKKSRFLVNKKLNKEEKHKKDNQVIFEIIENYPK